MTSETRPEPGDSDEQFATSQEGRDAIEHLQMADHAKLMPIASPEPFELFEDQEGALVRRRSLPEGADSLMDRRLLEFCRGSLGFLCTSRRHGIDDG